MKKNAVLIVTCLAAVCTVFGANAARKADKGTDGAPDTTRQAPPADSTQMSDQTRWACEVAMCMSNPAGPTAVAECVAPIEKLYKELAKGHAFPSCPFLSD